MLIYSISACYGGKYGLFSQLIQFKYFRISVIHGSRYFDLSLNLVLMLPNISPMLPRWVLFATSLLPHCYLGFRGPKEVAMRTHRGESGEKLTSITGFGRFLCCFIRTPSHFWMIWRPLVLDLLYPLSHMLYALILKCHLP